MSVSEGWKGGDELACWPIIVKEWMVEPLGLSSIKVPSKKEGVKKGELG